MENNTTLKEMTLKATAITDGYEIASVHKTFVSKH